MFNFLRDILSPKTERERVSCDGYYPIYSTTRANSRRGNKNIKLPTWRFRRGYYLDALCGCWNIDIDGNSEEYYWDIVEYWTIDYRKAICFVRTEMEDWSYKLFVEYDYYWELVREPVEIRRIWSWYTKNLTIKEIDAYISNFWKGVDAKRFSEFYLKKHREAKNEDLRLKNTQKEQSKEVKITIDDI